VGAAWCPWKAASSAPSGLTPRNRHTERWAVWDADVPDLDSVLAELASDIAHDWTAAS
jgi:hypothetical protein